MKILAHIQGGGGGGAPPRIFLHNLHEGTQSFIRCLFKAVSLAMLNKQMLSPFATYDALSLVITKPSFIWFGSTSVDICTALVNRW